MLRALFFNALIISAVMSLISLMLMLITNSRRYPIASKWKCLCWTVLSLSLIIPLRFDRPLIEIKIPVSRGIAADKLSELVPNIGEITADAMNGAGGTQNVSHINRPDYAVFLWLLGVSVFIIWHAAVYITLRRGINKASRGAEGVIQNKANEIALQMKIRSVRVRVCSERISPMLMGIIRPVIYLPDNMTAEQLEIALCHELTHLRRKDIIYKFLLTVANAVHWFNPVIWLMACRADRDAEAACDEAVLANSDTAERKAYCNAILDMMNGRRIPFATAFSYKKEDIMKRFKNIMNTSKRKSGLIIITLLLCVSVLLSGVIGCTAEQEIPETPKTTTTMPKPITTTTTTATTAETTTTTTTTTAADSTWVIYEGDSYMDAGRAMELINDYRERNGLLALWTGSENLSIAATDRLMESLALFSHTRPNGQRYSTVFAENGFFYSVVCENLARGQLTAEEVVNQWIASPTHQANLLDPNLLYGCVQCAKGYYDGMEYVYWIFMAYAP